MEQNCTVGLLGRKMLMPKGSAGPSCMRRPTLSICLVNALGLSSFFKRSGLHMKNFSSAVVQSVDVLNGWFWMARKSALDGVGLLDEQFFMYGEDVDWCRRFWKKGSRVVHFPNAAAIHYGEGSSSRAPIRFYIEMHRANLKYWKRHHNSVSQVVYGLIVILHEALRVLGYGAVYALKRSARSEASFKLRRSMACLRWLFGMPPGQHPTTA